MGRTGLGPPLEGEKIGCGEGWPPSDLLCVWPLPLVGEITSCGEGWPPSDRPGVWPLRAYACTAAAGRGGGKGLWEEGRGRSLWRSRDERRRLMLVPYVLVVLWVVHRLLLLNGPNWARPAASGQDNPMPKPVGIQTCRHSKL